MAIKNTTTANSSMPGVRWTGVVSESELPADPTAVVECRSLERRIETQGIGRSPATRLTSRARRETGPTPSFDEGEGNAQGFLILIENSTNQRQL